MVNTLVKRAKAARDNVALMGSDRGELTGGEAGQAGENTVAKRARVARDSVGSTVNAVGKRVGAAGGNVASTVNTVRKRAWQGVARIVRREQEQHEEQEL